MRLQPTPTTEDRGLPPGQAVVVSGALVVGLALVHFIVGVPESAGDWLILAAAATLSPAIGYKLATRQADSVLGILLFIYATALIVATTV